MPVIDSGFGQEINRDRLRLNLNHVILKRLDKSDTRNSVMLQLELKKSCSDSILHHGYMKQMSRNCLRLAKVNAVLHSVSRTHKTIVFGRFEKDSLIIFRLSRI